MPQSDLLTPAHIIEPLVNISVLRLHFCMSQVYYTYGTIREFVLLLFSSRCLLVTFSIFIAFLLILVFPFAASFCKFLLFLWAVAENGIEIFIRTYLYVNDIWRSIPQAYRRNNTEVYKTFKRTNKFYISDQWKEHGSYNIQRHMRENSTYN
jgi:hypothetical protein